MTTTPLLAPGASTPAQIVLGLSLSLAVGGLMGLERERRARNQQSTGIGGARTYPLVCLLGALVALAAQTLGPALLAVGLAALTALVIMRSRENHPPGGGPRGLTSEVSALLIFLIGALPFIELASLPFAQRMLLAGALGTVITSVLALREPLHDFVAALSREDLLATVRFALAAVVFLPLLPDRAFGPYAAFNPFRTGVVIVLIAGISFVGYVAVRLLGTRRGMEVTALAGGLVSSTAVALTFSAKARERPELTWSCALAIALAATILFARVFVEILVVRPALAAHAALPLAVMLTASAIGCLMLWRRVAQPADAPAPTGLHNPFRLSQALRLGLAYAVVRFVAAAAYDQFGSGGLLASAALSGLADVDAITISVARMHGHGLATEAAVAAITIAVVSNTLVKVALVAAIGGPRVARPVAAVLLPAAVIGTAMVLFGR